MRELTICRKKQLAARLAAARVYISDENGDAQIGGVRCRKLGVLKNGQRAVFPVSEEAGRICVAADRVSREDGEVWYDLPAGSEPIVLTGRSVFRPGRGSAFSLWPADGQAVRSGRGKRARIGWIVPAAVLAAGVLLGLFLFGDREDEKKPEAAVFTVGELSVTLDDRFVARADENFMAVYASPEASVFILRKPFTLSRGMEELTAEEYCALVMADNGESGAPRHIKEIPCFDYTYTAPEGGVFRCTVFLYKGADAFWLLQFAVPQESAGDMAACVADWAGTVRFDT